MRSGCQIAQRNIAKHVSGCELGVEKDGNPTRLHWEQLASAKNRDAQPWSRQHKPCSMVIHSGREFFQQWDKACNDRVDRCAIDSN